MVMTEPTFAQRRRDAALEQVREWNVERQRIEELVLGRESRHRMGRLIKIDESCYVVEVLMPSVRDAGLWTTVYRDVTTYMYFTTVDLALLHLVGQRHDADDGAARYAARVLLVPNDE